jgi:alpha-galactosidase/6-phospho-beta-glucosidase family protein
VRALLAHPLIREWDLAVQLLDEIVAANASYLPAFRTAG